MWSFYKFQEHIDQTEPCSSRWDGFDRGDVSDYKFTFHPDECWLGTFDDASAYAKAQAKTLNVSHKLIRSDSLFVVFPL